MQLFQNICYLVWVKENLERLWRVAAGGAELLAEVGVAKRKAWPAVEKCLLMFSIIMDLSVVTVLPSLGAVGNWEEVLLFSMDITVYSPPNFHYLIPILFLFIYFSALLHTNISTCT